MVTARVLIIGLYLKYKKWNKIYNALVKKDMIEDDFVAKAIEEQNNYITIIDGDYPEELKQKPRPPFVIKKGK